MFVTQDEDIDIGRDGEPVASPNSLATVYGALRGRVEFAGDFDELPDDIAEAFGADRATTRCDPTA